MGNTIKIKNDKNNLKRIVIIGTDLVEQASYTS